MSQAPASEKSIHLRGVISQMNRVQSSTPSLPYRHGSGLWLKDYKWTYVLYCPACTNVKVGGTNQTIAKRQTQLEGDHLVQCPKGGHRLQLLAKFSGDRQPEFQLRFHRYWRRREWYAYVKPIRAYLRAAGRKHVPEVPAEPSPPPTRARQVDLRALRELVAIARAARAARPSCGEGR